jgi:hypothetical protein
MNVNFRSGHLDRMPTCKHGRAQGFCSCFDAPGQKNIDAAELLEALRILVACTEKLPGTHSLAIDNARAAIEKAIQVHNHD